MDQVSFACNVCNIVLNSQEQLEQHYVGKAHKRKIESQNGTKDVVKNTALKTQKKRKGPGYDSYSTSQSAIPTLNSYGYSGYNYGGSAPSNFVSNPSGLLPAPDSYNSSYHGYSSAGKHYNSNFANNSVNYAGTSLSQPYGGYGYSRTFTERNVTYDYSRSYSFNENFSSGGYTSYTQTGGSEPYSNYSSYGTTEHQPMDVSGYNVYKQASTTYGRDASGQPVTKKARVHIKCDACKLVLNSDQQYQIHLSGTKHKRNIANPTGAAKNGQSEQSSKASKKPSSETKPGTVDNATAVKQKKNQGNENRKGTQLLWCEACGVALNSTAQQEMHFSGKTHKRRVQEGNTGSQTGASQIAQKQSFVEECYCRVCDKQLNSVNQLNVHVQGKEHLNKLQEKGTAAPPLQANVVTTTRQENSSSGGSAAASTSSLTKTSATGNKPTAAARITTVAGKRKNAGTNSVAFPKYVVSNAQGISENGVAGYCNGWYFCKTCNISVPNSGLLNKHVKTEEHKAKLTGASLGSF